MTPLSSVVLDQRAVLTVGGADRRAFLQGLVSNDVERAGPGQAIHAALLTPQGKFLHDLFIVELGDTLLLDVEASRRTELLKRLSMYRLRSKVSLADGGDDWSVVAFFGAGAGVPFGLDEEAGHAMPTAGGVVFVDPRLPALGLRAILPRGEAEKIAVARGFAQAPSPPTTACGWPRAYRTAAVTCRSKGDPPRIGLRRAERGRLEEGLLHGAGADRPHQVSRPRAQAADAGGDRGPVPAPGTPLFFDGKDAGEMRSGVDGLGPALVRLEAAAASAAAGRPIEAGASRLVAKRPDWARF